MNNNSSQTRKILLLSANPRGTGQLRLDEEMREIKEVLRRSEKRDQYLIDTAEAVLVTFKNICYPILTPIWSWL